MIHKFHGGARSVRNFEALVELLLYFILPKPGMKFSPGRPERVLGAPVSVLVVQGGVSILNPATWAHTLAISFKLYCRAARRQKRRPKRLFEHLVISFDASDKKVLGLTPREQGTRAIELAMGLLAASTLYECPTIFVAHGDSGKIHVHCAVLGCDMFGKVWSSRSPAVFAELKRLCREAEVANGLYRVVPKAEVRTLSAGEKRHQARTGLPAPRAVLQQRLSSVLAEKPSPVEFGEQCLEQHVLVVPKLDAKGRISGISYRLLDGDETYGFGMQRHFSGSDLGKRFVWGRVAEAINYEDSKHRPVADHWALQAHARLSTFRCVLRPAPSPFDLTVDAIPVSRKKKRRTEDASVIERPSEIVVVEPRPKSIRRALAMAARRGWKQLAAMRFRHLFEPLAGKLGIAILPDRADHGHAKDAEASAPSRLGAVRPAPPMQPQQSQSTSPRGTHRGAAAADLVVPKPSLQLPAADENEPEGFEANKRSKRPR